MSDSQPRTPVSAEEFERLTGYKATAKYLEWINCPGKGCMHWRCGWCRVDDCGRPSFLCGHPQPARAD